MNEHEPERLDLSPLDPAADELAYERRIRRVLDAAAPLLLARRSAATGPLLQLAGWARPMLAAAAVVALVALGALNAVERRGAQAMERDTVVDALGVPAPAADWLAEGREPTEEDLVLAMERRR